MSIARSSAVAAVLAIVTLVVSPAPAVLSTPAGVILGAGTGVAVPGRYIVVLNDSPAVHSAGITAMAGSLSNEYGGKLRSVYQRTLSGFSVAMSEDAARRLAADPRVAYVEQDQVVRLADTQENPPRGLDRIDQRDRPLDRTFSYDFDLTPVTAYIIDSGIRITHTEFGGRARYGWDFVDNDATASDCEGHGTHVAGIVGGKTYGVAKNINLVAVRAFDCFGESTSSSVQDGIEWVTAHVVRPAVINLSIGLYCTVGGNPAPCQPGAGAAVKTAITNAVTAGISFVVAAGNGNVDACDGPFNQVPGTVRVSAVDEIDAKLGEANWGGCVDLWAPGQNIFSAGHVNDTASLSDTGTSMAAPHVTGAIALMMARPEPTRTPAELRAQLLAETTPNRITGLSGASPNKLLYVSPPPIAGGSSIALARHQNGRLALFGVNRGGRLFYRSQTQVNSEAWSEWKLSVYPNWYSVCADTDSADHFKLVGLRRNDEVWHRGQAFANSDSVTMWKQFDGLLNSCAVAFDGTRVRIFGTNSSSDVWSRSDDLLQGGYTPWVKTGIGFRAVAAELNGNGLVEVFGLGLNGAIFHCWNTANNCGIGPWNHLDGQLSTIALGRNQSGALTVFGVNPAGQLFQRMAAPGTNLWFNWSQLDVPSMVGTPRSVAAETNGDGRITLITVNTAGQIWQRKQASVDSATYGPWTQLDGQLRP